MICLSFSDSKFFPVASKLKIFSYMKTLHGGYVTLLGDTNHVEQ